MQEFKFRRGVGGHSVRNKKKRKKKNQRKILNLPTLYSSAPPISQPTSEPSLQSQQGSLVRNHQVNVRMCLKSGATRTLIVFNSLHTFGNIGSVCLLVEREAVNSDILFLLIITELRTLDTSANYNWGLFTQRG